MNRAISWLSSVLVRLTLTIFLVVTTFFLSAALSDGNSFQAQAEPLTPEATKYKINSPESPFQEKDEGSQYQAQGTANNLARQSQQATTNVGENAKEAGNNLADTIREKLNLDQPLYPGTKEVLDDAADAIRGNQD